MNRLHPYRKPQLAPSPPEKLGKKIVAFNIGWFIFYTAFYALLVSQFDVLYQKYPTPYDWLTNNIPSIQKAYHYIEQSSFEKALHIKKHYTSAILAFILFLPIFLIIGIKSYLSEPILTGKQVKNFKLQNGMINTGRFFLFIGISLLFIIYNGVFCDSYCKLFPDIKDAAAYPYLIYFFTVVMMLFISESFKGLNVKYYGGET